MLLTINAATGTPQAQETGTYNALLEPQEVQGAMKAEAPVFNTDELISLYAESYGVKEASMRATLRCESEFKHEGIYGDGGLAYGIAQFHENTFEYFKKLSGMSELDYRSEEDQIKLMAWAFANDNASHWSCWRKYKAKQLAMK